MLVVTKISILYDCRYRIESTLRNDFKLVNGRDGRDVFKITNPICTILSLLRTSSTDQLNGVIFFSLLSIYFSFEDDRVLS